MKHELKHPYITVDHGGRLLYGGNQRLSRTEAVRDFGCGIVAATDTLLYLHRHMGGGKTPFFLHDHPDRAVPLAIYRFYMEELEGRYLPMIPGFGVNCLVLAAAMERYFRRYRVPLTARWGVWSRKMWDTMGEMLGRDIPCILCVGHNFPLLWQKHKLNFYVREGERLRRSCQVKGHFVTVTGLDDDWLRLSSWGREYWISRQELEEFTRLHTTGLFTNILLLSPKNR